MLKKILELDGVHELNKNQQQTVNGGKKCKTLPSMDEDAAFWEEAGQPRCILVCRPTFLGIGVGSWTLENTDVAC